jgi:hypothetical protein
MRVSRDSRAACTCVRVMAFELEVISEGKHADLLRQSATPSLFNFICTRRRNGRSGSACT